MLGIFFKYRVHDKKAPPATASVNIQEAYWKSAITSRGGKVAYADFGRVVSVLTPEMQHQEAHVFGGALYDAEGLAGLAVCDAEFSFGCFHEFLGRAIAQLGFSSIAELNQACTIALGSTALSCRHGIGHGILAYLGYSDADLTKALATCKQVSTDDPIGGCDVGVFMEYNLRVMLGVDGKVRPEHGTDMQFPCDSVSDEAKATCYYAQPQWWQQNFRKNGLSDEQDMFQRIGELCAEAPSQYQRNCFEGVGVIAPAAVSFSGENTLALCESASADVVDQLYCRSFAANAIFTSGGITKDDASVLCEGLTGDSYEFCSSYATNKSNIAVPMELTAR